MIKIILLVALNWQRDLENVTVKNPPKDVTPYDMITTKVVAK